jgi:hypothetical protein
MANREDMERAERLSSDIENTDVMRELYPHLSWYWDKVDALLKQYEAAEDMIARRVFDYD